MNENLAFSEDEENRSSWTKLYYKIKLTIQILYHSPQWPF